VCGFQFLASGKGIGQHNINERTCYTQDGPAAGSTLFSLFAGQQINILGSQHVDLYWRQGVGYIESAEQSRTAEPNKIDG